MAYSFLQTATDNASATTYTFTAQSLGTADSTRIIIVAAMIDSGSATTISAITVGGVSATIDHSYAQTRALAIASASVPTGTTGDVVVTASASGTRCAIALWRVTGVTLALADHDESVANPGTITLTPGGTGDYIFAAGRGDTTGGGTWTGATEDFDVVVEALRSFSGASMTTSSGSNVTVDVNFAATTREVAASYTPTAAGGTPATFTGLTGSATAAGGTTTMTGAAAFTSSVGTAAANGGTASMQGQASFAATVGTASAAGGTASMTGAATFTASVGTATADGGIASMSVGGAPATFAALTGSATASGGAGAMTGAAAFSASVGLAAASGGSASMTGAASFSATVGLATAAGGTASMSGAARFAALAGAAIASGAAAVMTGAANFIAAVGQAIASGGVASMTIDAPIPIDGVEFSTVRPQRRLATAKAQPALTTTGAQRWLRDAGRN